MGTDPMSVVFDGAHAARSRRGKHRHHPHRPPRFRNRGATPWAWTALCSKKNKVATPFHSNRMERRRHVAPFLGSHAANHASKFKEAEVATANTDRGRAPGLVSAFLVALTKRFRTARPAGRAPLLSAPSPTPHCDAFTHHVRQMSGHDVSVAAEKRARWKSAFMAAPTKRCSTPRPAWRVSVGRAAPHASHPCHVARTFIRDFDEEGRSMRGGGEVGCDV